MNQEFDHVSGDPRQHLSYQARIFSFPTDAAAAAFVPTVQAEFQTNAYYTNIAPITPSGLPGAAAAVSYDFPRGDGFVASGHRLWSQIGTFVVMIEVDRVGGAPLQGVTELALAQIACVQAGSCPQILVPASLLGA